MHMKMTQNENKQTTGAVVCTVCDSCIRDMIRNILRGDENNINFKMEDAKQKKEPIYEKLSPSEVLIIAKNEDGSLDVVEFINGVLKYHKVTYEDG